MEEIFLSVIRIYAYNLWQYDRQNKNVEKIVKTAADLYDKESWTSASCCWRTSAA